MAKKLAILMLVLSMAVSVFAFAESEADQELYDSIITAEYLSLEELDAQISGIETNHAGLAALQQDVADMKACSGSYVQINKYSDTDKTYTAEVSYYFEKGVAYCTVDYTNYAGTLDAAPVERIEVDADAEGGTEENAEENYLFITHPTGTFYSRSQEFTIRIGVEGMRVQWADSCDYTLDRGSGAQSELDPVKIPFTETEDYTTIIETLDKSLGDYPKRYVYDEETATLYAYITIGQGLKYKLETYPDQLEGSWQNLIDNLLPFSEKIGAILKLSVRDGITDFTQTDFTIMIVDMLSTTDSYSPDEVLCVITDGVLEYNILDDNQAPPPSPTT